MPWRKNLKRKFKMKSKLIVYKQILEKKDYLPFYVYDYDIIKGQILKLKNNLPKNVELFYSAKANPNLAILKIMNNFNLGLEIISLGELSVAKKANFRSKKIFFAGSTKRNQELLLATKENVDLFSLESVFEMERIDKIANSLNKKVNIVLRINFEDSLKKSHYKQTKISGFGIPLEELRKILNSFSKHFPSLILKGVHVYRNSRVSDPRFLLETINRTFSIIKDIENKYKLNFEIINIGGGFEANAKKELSVIDYCKKLSILIKKYNFNNKRIILELGRYLVNNSGIYVTEIIDVSEKNDTNFLIVEGIFNHLLKFLTNKPDRRYFVEIKDNFIVEALPRRNKKLYPTVIRGQISIPANAFGYSFDCKFLLPEPKVGDFIMIKSVKSCGKVYGNSIYTLLFDRLIIL